MNTSVIDINRVIEMAWEDRTPFDAIKDQYNISESAVIKIMRANLKQNSFRLWRERVTGRKTKHRSRSQSKTPRFRASTQL